MLDTLQKIFSVIGSLSIAVALAAYIYKRRQDKNVAAIEQISFFRKEIIPAWEEASNILRRKNKNYMFSRIKIDEPTIEFTRRKYSINFQDQSSIFLNDLNNLKADSKIWDSDILDLQIKLFNMLEEFALKVFHFKTSEHRALNSVKAVFVDVVEKNAVALIFVRDVISENPIYSEVLSLYYLWRDGVNKPFFLKNLEKHGFITKKQKEKLISEVRNGLVDGA